MLSAALVSLSLLQAVAGTSSASGPVLAERSSAEASAPIPLRFGLADAWGCLYAASNTSYCRHLGVATDGESLMAAGSHQMLLAANGAVYVRCGWALNGGTRPSLCSPPTGLDPAAYTSWLQAQPVSWEEYSMVSKGAILGRELAEQKARTGGQRSPPPPMPGIHPDAPRPQTTSGGTSRPAQRSGPTRPSGSRSGGQELP